MTISKNCGKAIKWFKDPVNDKWIPLEANYFSDVHMGETLLQDVLSGIYYTLPCRCVNPQQTTTSKITNNKMSAYISLLR
jgi:hypothetical protein